MYLFVDKSRKAGFSRLILAGGGKVFDDMEEIKLSGYCFYDKNSQDIKDMRVSYDKVIFAETSRVLEHLLSSGREQLD